MPDEVKTVVVRLIGDVDSYRAAMASAGATTASTSASIDKSLASSSASLTSTGLAMTKSITPAALAMGAAFMVASNQYLGGSNALRTETGKTGSALDGLVTSMRNVGSEVPESLTKVGQEMGIIADKTGLTGPPLEALTRQLLELNHMGQDLSADQLTAALNQFSISGADASQALNQLYRISQLTGVGVSTLAGQLQQYGAPLQALGYGFTQSAELLGNFNKSGLNTMQLLQSLRQAFTNLSAAGKDPREALQALFAQIQQLGPGVESTDLAMTTFGRRGGTALLEAVLQNKVSIADLNAELATNTDTIDAAAQSTFTFSDRIHMLANDVIGAIGPYAQLGEYIAFGIALLGPFAAGVGVAGTALGVATDAGLAYTASLVAAAGAETTLEMMTAIFTGIMSSQALAIGGTVAALVAVGIAYENAQHNAESATQAFQAKIDFSDYREAVAGIDAASTKLQQLSSEFQGNPLQVTQEKLANPGDWAEFVTLSNQYNQNLAHINAETQAFNTLAKDLGVTASQAVDIGKKLGLDPTLFESSQGQFDKLKTVLAAVQAGTISYAEAQTILGSAIQGTTLSQQQQQQADEQTQTTDKAIADSAKGLLDAQSSLTTAQQSAEDAQANLNTTLQAGTQLDIDAQSAKLGLKDAQDALNDAQSEGASLQRSAAEAGLDVQSAKIAVTDAQAQLTKDQADPTKTAEDIAKDQLAVQKAELAVGDATDRAAAAQKKQAGQGEDVAKAALGVQSAQQKVSDTQDAITKHATDVQKAQQAVETAYYQTTTAAVALAVAQTQVDNAGQATQYQIAQSMIPSLQDFADTLSPTDPLRANLEAYIGQLQSIPPDPTSTVTLDTAAAQVALNAWVAQLAADKKAGELDWFQSILIPGQPGTPPAAPAPSGPPPAHVGGRAGGGGVYGDGRLIPVDELGTEGLVTGGHPYLLMPPGQSGNVVPAARTAAALAGVGAPSAPSRGGIHIENMNVGADQPKPTAREVVYSLHKAATLNRIK